MPINHSSPVKLIRRRRTKSVRNSLKRSNVLVVCGSRIDEVVKNDIAIGETLSHPGNNLKRNPDGEEPRSKDPTR